MILIHGLVTTYTNSGIYDSLFTNSSGCDSLVVLDLTINTLDTTITQQTACNSYIWLGTIYTTSGVYDSLFTNSSGCDSLVTLDLTINTSDTTSIQDTACDTYTLAWNYLYNKWSL